MHCDKCNTQVSAEDRFCNNCFNTLHREESFSFDMNSVLKKNAIVHSDSQMSGETSREEDFTTEVAIEEPQGLEQSIVQSEVALEKPQGLGESVAKSELPIKNPQISKEPVVRSQRTSEMSNPFEDTLPGIVGSVAGALEKEFGLRKANRRILITHPALLNYKHFAIAITVLLLSLTGIARTPSFIFFIISVVPSGIFLFAISYIKHHFVEKGYVDFPIGQGGVEKTRFFPDGRKERHVKEIMAGWKITDITDPTVVSEIKSWE